jgi:protein gp37
MVFDRINEGRWWDRPWSLVEGCTRCSPGCDNCWALAMERRFRKPASGPRPRVVDVLEAGEAEACAARFNYDRLAVPLHRRKPTAWAVWNDLFHEDVPINAWEAAFSIMARCPQHIFLVLTKRADRLKLLTTDRLRCCPAGTLWPLPNLWLGVTACNQAEADAKIPKLLAAPAAVRFLSIEPMLGTIELPQHDQSMGPSFSPFDWIVCGAETGAGARPMNPDWARILRDQCLDTGVPFFLKQLGNKAGRVLDGRTWEQIPVEAKS